MGSNPAAGKPLGGVPLMVWRSLTVKPLVLVGLACKRTVVANGI